MTPLRFPLPGEPGQQRRTLDEFRAELSTAITTAKRWIFKLERLQSYQQPGNPSYEAFIRGDWPRAIALAAGTHEREHKLYTTLATNGVRFVRVHIVEHPLTDYLRWEFEHYKIVSALGEDVRIVEHEAVVELDHKVNLMDFMLYDLSLAHVLEYSDGLLTGVVAVTDDETLRDLEAVATALVAESIPFAARAHP